MTDKERPTDAQQEPTAEEVAQQVQENTETEPTTAGKVAQEVQEPPLAITIDTEGIKNLEDMTPEELDQWRAQVPVMSEHLQETMRQLSAQFSKSISSAFTETASLSAALSDSLSEVYESVLSASRQAFAAMTEVLKTEVLKAEFQLPDWFTEIEKKFNAGDYRFLTGIVEGEGEDGEALLPFIIEEIETIEKERGGEKLTFSEFVKKARDPETGNHGQSLFEQCIEKAKQRQEAAAAAARLASDLPHLQPVKPKAHTMPNNALMNVLQQKPAINAGAFDLIVANEKGRRREITAYTMISLDPEESGVKITDTKLTEYERQVSDAIISLWLEAEKGGVEPVFSPDTVFRAMPGGGDKASPQQKGAITKALEKFRRLHIYCDATEEMQKRGIIPDNETFTFDSYYLSATHVVRKTKNGRHTVHAYRIDAEPIILTYCKLTSQLLTVPAKYIEIQVVKKGKASSELVTMTADRQAMTGYMLRRIAVMKHDKRNKVQTQSNIILFETLFTETGTKTDNRKQTMNNRNFCFNVLEYWKATGYIEGYTKQIKGRSVTSVIIDL